MHLEIVEASDTDSFINAFRHFTNGRGCPETVFSDCGTDLTGAVNELHEFKSALKKDVITKADAKMKIIWEFNPPATPYMERCMGTFDTVVEGGDIWTHERSCFDRSTAQYVIYGSREHRELLTLDSHF